MTLNLFPARVPIGRATGPDGSEYDVLMTPEFARALSDLFQRVGGASGMGSQDLAVVATFSTVPMQTDSSASMLATFQDAQIASLRAELESLRGEIGAIQSFATLGQQIEDLRSALGMIEEPSALVRYLLATVPVPASVAPLIDGTAAIGTSVKYARQDHVHPTDTTRQATIVKGTATGSRGGNAALASLLTALAGSGLVIDSTTA